MNVAVSSRGISGTFKIIFLSHLVMVRDISFLERTYSFQWLIGAYLKENLCISLPASLSMRQCDRSG